ncbi:MAG: DUF2203 family protein [archaeon]|jgi:hypothetical protein
MSKIYFSLGEANEMVQQIKHQIEKLACLRDELELLDNTKIEFDVESIENYLLEVELNRNFHEKSLEVYTILGNLIKDGAIVRNLDDLEVDFYSKLNNKDIVFCWQLGQDKINFWHYPSEDKKLKRQIKEIEKQYMDKLKEFR